MRKVLTFAAATTMTAGALFGGLAAPANAAPNQAGRAAGVIAAVVQVDRTLNDVRVLNGLTIGDIEVVTIKDSLNNALRNSPILSNNVVTVQDFLNNCTVLSCITLQDFLNENDVLITDVVAIDVLSGGDVVVFAR